MSNNNIYDSEELYDNSYPIQDNRPEGITGRPSNHSKEKRLEFCKNLYDTTSQQFENKLEFAKYYEHQLSLEPRTFDIPRNFRYLKKDVEELGLCFPNYPVSSRFTTATVRQYIHSRLKKVYLCCKNREDVIYDRGIMEPLSEDEIDSIIKKYSSDGPYKDSAVHIYFVFTEAGMEAFLEKLYLDMFESDYPTLKTNMLYSAYHNKCTEFVFPGSYVDLFRLDIWELIRP